MRFLRTAALLGAASSLANTAPTTTPCAVQPRRQGSRPPRYRPSSVAAPTPAASPTPAPTVIDTPPTVIDTPPTVIDTPPSVIDTPPTVIDTTPTEAAPPAAPLGSAAELASDPVSVAQATAVPGCPKSRVMCGDNDQINLDSYGLLVSNSRVVESGMQGSVCTTYNEVVSLSGGQVGVSFGSDASIAFDDRTMNANKVYSNVAITKNVDKKLSAIKSMPASFTWSRSNTTDFRGNIALDFVLAPSPHDWTSAASMEFQMWLHWQGDQRPLAWDKGIKASWTLWGRDWDVYQGTNYNLADGRGVVLTTIVPRQSYGAEGHWDGDVKDWMDVLADQGYLSRDHYLNVANAGTEQFYGDSRLSAVVSLQINLV